MNKIRVIISHIKFTSNLIIIDANKSSSRTLIISDINLKHNLLQKILPQSEFELGPFVFYIAIFTIQ